ncbi:alpha/beta hydrolase family protein [Pedobacter boryungensis]|uniref:Acetylxylan esterase n=1 Tax=Pedobacter boryungensis TaxID=869962 RepID=A0ABX2DAR4_9SPHI|nr:acetylxylan esterase [Pedobacter boryungensis]NQX30518.1 acetylxylan esterase [Pedobacter boryungensis]
MIKNLAIFILFQFLICTAFAQKSNILDWKTDVSLNTYLVQQMHLQYDARKVTFNKALTSKTNTIAYIQSVKQKIKAVIGTLPQKASLNPQITGTIQKSGYRIEKIVYQSFKNHHVTTNLYIPEGKGKFPTVLLFCGHEDLAKATESYQQTAILFAKNGFVVFVIDPISQSERVQLTDQTGKALTRGSTTEHTLLNLSSNLLGTSVAAYELLDNICGLDYLETRSEVDNTKIGCIGNSGGAMQAIYFAGFDDRVKIIAPCSYLASRERTLETTGAADGCAQIPGEGSAQLEMSDYLIAAAPKPILVLAGRYDFIDYTGTLQSVDELKKVYQKLESPEKLSLFTFDDGHGISKPKREAAVQWFRKWFYNDAKPIQEGNLETLTDKDLFASTEGKVNISYPDEVNIPQKNLQMFKEKAEQRRLFALKPLAEKQQKIRKLLGIPSTSGKIEIEKVGKGKIGHFDTKFEELILRKRDEVPLPMRIYYPSVHAKKIRIWVSDDTKKKDSIISQSLSDKNEEIIIAVDLRGTGETTDKPALNDPKYFNIEYRNAMLALHINKPIIGQRVTDILSVLEFINNDITLKELPIEINSIGLNGLSVLHAAFLNFSIAKINLFQCISSYQEILNQPLAKDRYGVVVHNVLSYYDIPDLINWIGEEKVKFNP